MANFMSLPPMQENLEVEADDLKRRQAIADAMQASALQPLQMPQQPGVKLSPVNVLAKVAEAYFASKKQQDLKQERTAYGNKFNEQLVKGLEQYYKTSQGGLMPAAGQDPNLEGPPVLEQAPGDPKKAILQALASNHPVLREMAMKQMMQKPVKSELKEVGGIVYDPETRQMVQLGGAQPQQRMHNGDLYEQNPSTGQWRKLDNAPKVTTNVNNSVVNKGESEFMKKIGTASAEDAIAAKQSMVAGQRTIQSMQKLDALDKAGVFSGPAANISMTLGSFAQSLGMNVDEKKLANSQAYQGELMGQLSNQLTGSLARSTTDKDMEILKAPLPQLLNSPEGRAALRRQAIAKAQENIEYAQRVQANVESAFPEAGRLMGVMPGEVPVPQRMDVPGARPVRKYNPATGRIE